MDRTETNNEWMKVNQRWFACAELVVVLWFGDTLSLDLHRELFHLSCWCDDVYSDANHPLPMHSLVWEMPCCWRHLWNAWIRFDWIDEWRTATNKHSPANEAHRLIVNGDNSVSSDTFESMIGSAHFVASVDVSEANRSTDETNDHNLFARFTSGSSDFESLPANFAFESVQSMSWSS